MRRFVDTQCGSCGREYCDQFLDWNNPYPMCVCGGQTVRVMRPASTAAVVGDDIVGGIEIKHGVCWPDGSPRKFYSKTDIRKAAKEQGLSWGYDLNQHVPLRGSDKSPHTCKW